MTMNKGGGRTTPLRKGIAADRRMRKEVFRTKHENEKQNLPLEQNSVIPQQDVDMEDVLRTEDARTKDAQDTPASSNSIEGTLLGVTQGWALVEKHNGILFIENKKRLDSSKYNNWDTKELLNPIQDLDRAKALKKEGRLGDANVTVLKYDYSTSQTRRTVILKLGRERLRISKSEYDKLQPQSKSDGGSAQNPPTVVERQPTPGSGWGENSSAAPSVSINPQDVVMEDAQDTPASSNGIEGTLLGVTQGWALVEKHDGILFIENKKRLDSSKYNNWDTKELLNPIQDLDRAKALKTEGRLGDANVTVLKYDYSTSQTRRTVILKLGRERLRISKSEYDKLQPQSKSDGGSAQNPPTVVERQPTPGFSLSENSGTASSGSINPETQSVGLSAETSLAGEGLSSNLTSGTILGRWDKGYCAIITGVGSKQTFRVVKCDEVYTAQYNGADKLHVDLKEEGAKSNISKAEFKQEWRLKDAARYRFGNNSWRYVVWLQPASAGTAKDTFINITTYSELGGEKKHVTDLIEEKEKQDSSPQENSISQQHHAPMKSAPMHMEDVRNTSMSNNSTQNPRSKTPTNTRIYGPGTVVPTIEIGHDATAATERPENSIANQRSQDQSTAKTIALPWSGNYYIEARSRSPSANFNPHITKQNKISHLIRDENGNYRSIWGSELVKQEMMGSAKFFDHDKNVTYNPRSDRIWIENYAKFEANEIQVLGLTGYMVGNKPIATAIFQPIKHDMKEALRSHRQRSYGDTDEYEYDGPVRCTWTLFKEKTHGKDEALGLLAKTDPAFHAKMMERPSNSPSPRLQSRSRSRSKTPGANGSLEQKIGAVFAKANLDIFALMKEHLARDVDSGYRSG